MKKSLKNRLVNELMKNAGYSSISTIKFVINLFTEAFNLTSLKDISTSAN